MAFDKVILGEGNECVFSMDSDETGLNNNILVCGSSGCGKTMSISEGRLLETFSTSLVATVNKRRIVEKYKRIFRERGYKVQDLNFVQPYRANIGYDPLEYVGNCQDILYLAEAIVKSNPRKDKSHADPYWDDASVSLLSAEIAYVMTANETPSFADVLDMHERLEYEEADGRIRTSYDKVFDYLAENAPGCFAVSCWKSFSRLPIKTASCVFGNLNTALNALFTPELRKLMTMKRKVDFENLASQRTVLFVTTSPVNPALNGFLNIFYGQIFKKLFEFAEKQSDGTLPVPVHILCDDFAIGSKIQNFAELISIFREKKISVTLLLQSESQLESIYGQGQAATIINNCDTYIYMGGVDLQTAKNISLRINAPLEDVLYMPLGAEILFRRGQKPIKTNRYNILQNELYQKVAKQHENSIAKLERQL